MPERWERELRKLGGLEPNERLIRERASRRPSSDRRPRGNALVAGIVAGAVAAAGIAALSQLDRNPDGIGTENDPSPTLRSSGSIVIDIQRSSDETGDPEAIARLGDQEVWMCPDGWTLVNPDGTEDSIIFDCGQSDVFQAPVGTPIEVTGDFATLSATARLSASDDRPNYPAGVVPTIDAGSVVFYQYEASWNDGSEASFWLLLTVQDDGALGGPHPEIVVRIYPLGERSAEMPIITATYKGVTKRGCPQAFEWTLPDGTRVAEAAGRSGSILHQCSYGSLFRVPPGIPISVEVPTATAVFATRTMTPFYEGREWFGASVRWPGGDEGDFSVSFDVVGSPESASIELGCAVDEQVEFVTPDGPRRLPGGSAFIRLNLAGVQQSDVIEQMTRKPGGTSRWDGAWQVVRDGSVVAAVDFGSLRGVACRGSGIGGV